MRGKVFRLSAWLCMSIVHVFCEGLREKEVQTAADTPVTVTWCNFTDPEPLRTLQGPTGGTTSVSSSTAVLTPGTGLSALPVTDVQTKLEAALGVRFQALGGPRSVLLVKLAGFFGAPGIPPIRDAGPPASVDQLPDVFPYGVWCTGNPPNEAFIETVCAGMTEAEVRTYMPGMARAVRNVSPSFGGEARVWDYMRVGGTIRWLPLNIEESFGETAGTPAGILWRADILEELGLAVPSTIEQVGRTFEAYHRQFPGKAVWRDDHSMWDWRSVYTATGVPYGNWVMLDRGASPWWIQPEIKRALATLQTWYQKGYLDISRPDRPGPEAFVTGDSILADLAEWESGNWVVQAPYIPGSLPYRTHELNPNATFVLGAPPAFEGVRALRLPMAKRNVLWGQFAFAKRLESDRAKLHRIMVAIDKIATDRDTFLLAYHGVEGRDWKWNGTGSMAYPEPLLKEAQRQEVGLGRFWTHALYGAFLEYRMNPRVLQSRSAMTSGAKALYDEQANRWHFDPRGLVRSADPAIHQRLYEKEKALYDQFKAVAERVVLQGEPVRAFDDYIQYWKDHGGVDLEAEVTRLIDRSLLR